MAIRSRVYASYTLRHGHGIKFIQSICAIVWRRVDGRVLHCMVFILNTYVAFVRCCEFPSTNSFTLLIASSEYSGSHSASRRVFNDSYFYLFIYFPPVRKKISILCTAIKGTHISMVYRQY